MMNFSPYDDTALVHLNHATNVSEDEGQEGWWPTSHGHDLQAFRVEFLISDCV